MVLNHGKPGEVLRLLEVGEPTAQTVALTKASSFMAIHLVVKAGDSLPTHKISGSITLYCIEGRIALETPRAVSEMKTRDWMFLDPGVPHSVRALADSALLLTILFDRVASHSDHRDALDA